MLMMLMLLLLLLLVPHKKPLPFFATCTRTCTCACWSLSRACSLAGFRYKLRVEQMQELAVVGGHAGVDVTALLAFQLWQPFRQKKWVCPPSNARTVPPTIPRVSTVHVD